MKKSEVRFQLIGNAKYKLKYWPQMGHYRLNTNLTNWKAILTDIGNVTLKAIG